MASLRHLATIAAQGKLIDEIGEKCRILFSFAQVVYHLYGQTGPCLKFPLAAEQSFLGLMDFFAPFSLDPTFRMPCYLKEKWDGYGSKLTLAMLLPLGFMAIFGLWWLLEVAVSRCRRSGRSQRAPPAWGRRRPTASAGPGAGVAGVSER